MGVTEDKIQNGNVTMKRNEELVASIVAIFTDIQNKMWKIINETALQQLEFYISSVMSRDNMLKRVKPYNEAFSKLAGSTFCSSEFKEAYNKAMNEHARTVTVL